MNSSSQGDMFNLMPYILDLMIWRKAEEGKEREAGNEKAEEEESKRRR